MIEGIRIAKYLKDTGLMMEEFYLLYRLMFQEENIKHGMLKPPSKEVDENVEFSKLSQEYQEKHQTYLDTGIDWVKICRKLSTEEYLTIWGNTPDVIKLTEMKVTEKFKQHFLISDVEQAFNDVLRLYPSWVNVKGLEFPAVDKSPEILAKLYGEHVLKGRNALLHERFLMITELYLKRSQSKYAKYKLSNWIIEAYHGVAYAYENDKESLTNNFGTDAN
jgi:hypothetical protein